MPSDTPHDGPGVERRAQPAWPPPGLESVQGRVWSGVAFLAIGALTLAVPLLASTAIRHPFWSVGPFRDLWWVPMIAAATAFLLVVLGYDRLFRIFWTGAGAVHHGHSWRTVLAAAADTGDTGYLLTGTGPFSEIAERERRWALKARLSAATLATAAAVWLPLALTAMVLLASARVLGLAPAWAITVVPPGLLGLAAILSWGLERAVVRGAERTWRASALAEVKLHDAVAAWNRGVDTLYPRNAVAAQEPGRVARRMRAGALVTLVLAPLTIIPVGTLTVASVVGPLLAGMTVPGTVTVQLDVAEVEVVRSYGLEPDPALDATEAATLLGALERAGSEAVPEGVQKLPAWMPEGADPFEGGVVEAFTAALTANQRAYLGRVADHPGHTMMARLARASAVDVAAGRWAMPLPDTLAWVDLPLPGFALAAAGEAHIAMAALRFAEGEPDRAELALREVLSVGFLLADNSVIPFDIRTGTGLVWASTKALESLYRATGRTREADDLARLAELGRSTAGKARAAAITSDPATTLAAVPEAVLDTTLARGIRWDLLGTITTLGPCLNGHNAVFGRGADYEAWLARAESSLVRFPGEAAVFAARRNGDVRPPAPGGPSFLTRLLSFTLGTPCATLLTSGG